MTCVGTATRAAICVPVRNERERLPAMLRALAGQAGVDPVRLTLCILFDGCDDDSAGVVAATPMPMTVRTATLAPDVLPNAGRARRAALALGVAALGTGDGVLLTTDADSVPAPDWVAATLAGLVLADVVAGRIARDAVGPQDRLDAYYDRLHALRRRIDPLPWEAAESHHQTGGASLAFTASAYAATGGFEARPAGEDAGIVDAAERIGLRVRRDAAVRVTTSARRRGRAEHGLADHLRALDAVDDPAALAVGHPGDAAWQYAGHAAARRAFGMAGEAAALARRLGCDAGHVARVAAEAGGPHAFAMRLVPAPPGAGRTVPLAEAERLLAALERGYWEAAA